jgi:hypothetical protein
VTDYRLDGPGIESRWGQDFSHVYTGPEAHPASCTIGTGSFPGVKQPGHGADHPPLLVPRLRMGRAIPLPPLQGHEACYRVNNYVKYKATYRYGYRRCNNSKCQFTEKEGMVVPHLVQPKCRLGEYVTIGCNCPDMNSLIKAVEYQVSDECFLSSCGYVPNQRGKYFLW